MSRLLVIDGHHLAHRAFHAMPELTAPDGRATGALTGVANLLVSALERIRPTHGLLVLDTPVMTRRHRRFEGYKGSRRPSPSPLSEQLARLPELADAFGLICTARTAFEADDLAAAATRLGAGETLILTGDRDLYGVVEDARGVAVLSPAPGGQLLRMDEAAVEARMGVPPRLIPDFKALTGDASDSLPGVPGIGEKSAAKALLAAGSLEALLADPSSLTPRLAEALRVHEDQARMVKELATLDLDAPLLRELPDLRLEVAEPGRLAEWAERNAMRKLVERAPAIEALIASLGATEEAN